MARYYIYDGGNLQRQPWESGRDSGLDPSYAARYSAHLTNFHKVLRYHVDFADEFMSDWLKLSVVNRELAAGDELGIHLYGPGTKIVDIVVQVKGACEPPAAGEPAVTPAVWELVVVDEANNVVQTVGQFDMTAAGYIPFLDQNIFLGTNGFLVARLVSGDADCGCFGVMANLVQFIDPYDCSCAGPCGAEFPDPTCPPAGLSNRGSLTGTGLASVVGDAPGEPGYGDAAIP